MSRQMSYRDIFSRTIIPSGPFKNKTIPFSRWFKDRSIKCLHVLTNILELFIVCYCHNIHSKLPTTKVYPWGRREVNRLNWVKLLKDRIEWKLIARDLNFTQRGAAKECATMSKTLFIRCMALDWIEWNIRTMNCDKRNFSKQSSLRAKALNFFWKFF